jgi:hypothetical protein
VESGKLSSDEETAFFKEAFPKLDKDNSGTLDVDELFGNVFGPDIVPLENVGPVHVSVDSLLLPKASLQEFIENHSSSGSLTLDEWLAAGPGASSGGNRVAASGENRVASKKTTRSASCTVQNLLTVPSTCSRTDWVDNCEDVCTQNCNSCRMAHPNSSAVARTSQQLGSKIFGGRRRRRFFSDVVDVVNDVVDVVECVVNCVTSCVWTCVSEPVVVYFDCVTQYVENQVMGFVDCLQHVHSAVANYCGTDLIPTSCNSVSS